MRHFRGLVEKIPYLRELGVTAVELMPADPYVAHMYAVATGPRVEGVRELKEVATRFPDYAPEHRDLAIAYWRVGDRAAAVRSAATAMEKADQSDDARDRRSDRAVVGPVRRSGRARAEGDGDRS